MNKKILINGITLENANLVPVLSKAKYFQSQNCQITFIGNSDLKAKIQQANILINYNFIEIPFNQKIKSHFDLIWQGLKRNIHTFKLIKKNINNFNIVYSCSSVLDLILFPYIFKKKNKNIKWVTILDNTVSFSFKPIKFLVWIFFKISLFCLKSADEIFVISEELKKFLIRHKFKVDKISVTGNAVESVLINQAVGNKYVYDGVFLGRLNQDKGIYDLLKILKYVQPAYPNFKLVLIGEGDTQTVKKFKQKIKILNLENNICFLGTQTGLEKFKILKSSKVFIFPSYTESFGLSLLEAVCCGLPALTYDLPIYKNIYQNNEIYKFKSGNWKNLANKILEIIKSQDFDNQAGKLLLKKYANWDKIAEIESLTF
ncbi:glycosyltransferase [Patescibacteria group bacterium]